MKKAQMSNGALWIIAVAFVVLVGGGATWAWQSGAFAGEQKAVGDTEKEVLDKEAQSCDGIQSVNLLYNDQNAYKAGTDPATNLTIYDPNRILVSDDATGTTGAVLKTFKGLAGNDEGIHETHYFAKEITFTTVCSDLPIQTELYQLGAPTITVVGDDAVTKLTGSGTSNETVAASTSFTATYNVKAPAEQCSAVYGAVVACEYDATYINSIESSDLTSKNYGIFEAHASESVAATWDQWKTFEWNGAVQDVDGDAVNDAGYLCDGKKIEFDIKYTHTSTSPSDDGANIKCAWLPINKDLDADSYDVITGIYDEDNNAIFIGNRTAKVYTNT